MKITEEQKETLIEWVKTLRSDKYQQIDSALCNEHGYCCLGVFAEMNIEEPLIDIMDYGEEIAYLTGEDGLQHNHKENINLKKDIYFLDEGLQKFLANLNDGINTRNLDTLKANPNFQKLNISDEIRESFLEYHTERLRKKQGNYTFKEIADVIEILFRLKNED